MFYHCTTLCAGNNVFKPEEGYVSLKSTKVNVRSGPSKDFLILYVYNLPGMPLRKIGTFENWIKVQDKDESIGWIQENLISKIRTVITLKQPTILYKKILRKRYIPIAKIHRNVVLTLLKCKADVCMVKISKKKGWVYKNQIWGY